MVLEGAKFDGMTTGPRILVVDHDDSFTNNLTHMLQELGVVATVVRAFDVLTVNVEDFGGILLSPGPGDPCKSADVGISSELIRRNPHLPILGVCLGHQIMSHVYGAEVSRASFPMHGQTSKVVLEDLGTRDPLFTAIPREFQVVRYHSLAVRGPCPDLLSPLAYGVEPDGTQTLMALRHKSLPHWGVQFHPESIGSSYGLHLLKNFVNLTQKMSTDSPLKLISDHTVASPQKRVRLDSLRPAVEPLRFSYCSLSKTEGETRQDLFGPFSNLQTPRVLLESSMVIPGFSRYSFTAGAPYLGPLSFTITFSSSQGVARCSGPGSPFVERSLDCAGFLGLLSELLAQRSAQSLAPFDFSGGFVGYIGFEVQTNSVSLSTENIDKEKENGRPGSGFPDACLLFVDRFLAYDHLLGEMYACSLEPSRDEYLWWSHTEEAATMGRGKCTETSATGFSPPENISFNAAHSYDEYLQCVERCKEIIRSGEAYQLCLTTRLDAAAAVCPFTIFQHLRRVNPAPYSFMYDFELPAADQGDLTSFAVLGASPERCLTVDRNGVATCKPMKGTSKRNLDNASEDAQLRAALAACPKNRAENLMIVDLVRHDLSTVCEPGSVRVPDLIAAETYATVHQLVSLVRGQLPEGRACPTAAFKACFPPGSMTGAPKIRSMMHLRELEKHLPRGVYSGASGYLSVSGAADLAVVIRTIVVGCGRCPRVCIGAGGAITLLSEANDEFEEMLLKADRLLQAIACYAPVDSIGKRGVRRSVLPASQGVASPAVPELTLLETMLLRPEVDSKPFLWDLHYRRLESSGLALGIAVPAPEELLAACQTAVGDSTLPQRMRLLLTRNGFHVEAVATEVAPKFFMDLESPPRMVCLDSQPSVHSADALLKHKTTWRFHYTAARQRTIAQGSEIFDVVMFNERREITETSIANVAVETEHGWRTPALHCGLLPGVMRAQLLEDGMLQEGIVSLDDLVSAALRGRRIICFNSVRGAYRVLLVKSE